MFTKGITEVCGRVDRCSYGRDDDGGVGEGGIMAERMEKGQHMRCRAAPGAVGGEGGSSCVDRPSCGSAAP